MQSDHRWLFTITAAGWLGMAIIEGHPLGRLCYVLAGSVQLVLATQTWLAHREWLKMYWADQYRGMPD